MTQEMTAQIAEKWKDREGGLLGALQQVQAEFNHVPPECLPTLAQGLGLPLSRVHSVVTFYSSFSLEPRGKHLVTCCLGTACHVRGAPRIVDEVIQSLEVEPGHTTKDGLFTFETARCLGTCALAPVVVIDGQYYGKMTTKKLRKALADIRKQEELD